MLTRFRFLIPVVVASLLMLVGVLTSSVAVLRAVESPPNLNIDALSDKEYDPNSLAARRRQVEIYARQYRAPMEYPPPDRVIYGNDDRLDIYAISNPSILKLAQAACLVVSTSELTNNGNGTYTLSASAWLTQNGWSICPDERFRGQMESGYCSAYLVGEDIIVTAGHCVNSSSCGSTAFVFGYQQIDSLTGPSLTIAGDDVYFCNGIIDQKLIGDLDHCVLQLDRPVVGHVPLPIRRTGSVSDGDSLIVVGHPVGLPMKAAGGAIVQNANGATAWFQANLDTYGGNSGSLVANLNDFTVEGILVRGVTDFVIDGSCIRSNQVPNSGNPGSGLQFEEISKTITFASFIPELVNSAGTCELDRTHYQCADTATVIVTDADLLGGGTQAVTLVSAVGDTETLVLTESPAASGRFSATIALSNVAVSVEDGELEVADGTTIIAAYADTNDGSGGPAVVEDSAAIDCAPPSISNVAVMNIQGGSATVTFETDELATPVIRYGPSCGLLNQSTAGTSMPQFQQVLLGGLTPETDYFFLVEAIDPAGNAAMDDNAGLCYTFTTIGARDYFTEEFATGDLDNDVDFQTLRLTPVGGQDFYEACRLTITSLPTDPAGGQPLTLGDDAFQSVSVMSGNLVSLYGVDYNNFYVGSNGYITFNVGDNDFTESLADHFGAPPRISALFDDLNPTAGGTISWKQLADRIAVTWDGIHEYSTSTSNTFQIELFFDGRISISHLGIAAGDGVVGVSAGSGVPGDLIESDLTMYPECTGCLDSDADGVCDLDDNCAAVPNPGQENADGDAFGDACDNCPAVANDDQLNSDADSLGDACDNCPAIANDDQLNSDADSLGDACDNCPWYANPGQEGCGHHGDLALDDGLFTIDDLNALIDQVFFNGASIVDTGCPHVSRADVNCDGLADITDVNKMIDTIFFNGPAFCNPCDCNPYPGACP